MAVRNNTRGEHLLGDPCPRQLGWGGVLLSGEIGGKRVGAGGLERKLTISRMLAVGEAGWRREKTRDVQEGLEEVDG